MERGCRLASSRSVSTKRFASAPAPQMRTFMASKARFVEGPTKAGVRE
jgi:hypothetical protein